MKEPRFASESAMCSEFIAALPKDWIAYPEWGGFDILLSGPGGVQVGIEAKLALNAKVVDQIMGADGTYAATLPGPDFRAVLVPEYATAGLARLCGRLGVTVVKIALMERRGAMYGTPRRGYQVNPYTPQLPDPQNGWADRWYDQVPWARVPLPEVVPDNAAGCSAPTRLTDWKIKAMKIAIVLETRGFVTRHDFKSLGISMSMWTQRSWIIGGEIRGQWVASNIPDFRRQHPINFEEIAALREKWMPPIVAVPTQVDLFL